MGWQLTDLVTQRRLERAFANRSIDPTTPGFCDHEAFIKAEKTDRRFLEAYAAFVEARTYDEAYLTEARTKINIVATVVRDAVAADGRLGACVDASGMVGRMLDRLGVWNYVAKTTLTISFGSTGHRPQYFWVLDDGNFVASHAIVVAPPYAVVDVTIKFQPYSREKHSLIPDVVLADRFESTNWTAEDLAHPDIRLESRELGFRRFADYIADRHPQILEVMEKLPARLWRSGEVTLKYVPVAVGGFIEPLEGVLGYRPCGKTALEWFEEQVVPQLPV